MFNGESSIREKQLNHFHQIKLLKKLIKTRKPLRINYINKK